MPEPGTPRLAADLRHALVHPEIPDAFREAALPILAGWLERGRAARGEPPLGRDEQARALRVPLRRVWRSVQLWILESRPEAEPPLVRTILEDLDVLHADVVAQRPSQRVFAFETADALAGLYPVSRGHVALQGEEEWLRVRPWWRAGRGFESRGLHGEIGAMLRAATLFDVLLAFETHELSPGIAAFGGERSTRPAAMPDLYAMAERWIAGRAAERPGSEGELDGALARMDVLDHIERTRERVLETFGGAGPERGARRVGRDLAGPPRSLYYARVAVALWGRDHRVGPPANMRRALLEDAYTLWAAAADCVSAQDQLLFLEADAVFDAVVPGASAPGAPRRDPDRSFYLQDAVWAEILDALAARSWSLRIAGAVERARGPAGGHAGESADLARLAAFMRADAEMRLREGIFRFGKTAPARRRLAWVQAPRFAARADLPDAALLDAARAFWLRYRKELRARMLARIEDVLDHLVAGARGLDEDAGAPRPAQPGEGTATEQADAAPRG
jgi:hypothetical protein